MKPELLRLNPSSVTSCVIPGKFLYLSVPEFPCPSNGWHPRFKDGCILKHLWIQGQGGPGLAPVGGLAAGHRVGTVSQRESVGLGLFCPLPTSRFSEARKAFEEMSF